MTKLPSLSTDEYETIHRFNLALIESFQDALVPLRAIDRKDRPAYVIGQIAYWQHLIKGFSWANHIAAQRAGVIEHAE